MTTPHDERRPIDAYLDNELTETERADFEGRVATDPDLARELDTMQRVGAATRRLYPMPDAAGSALPNPRPAIAGRIAPPLRWAAGAAAAIVLLVGGWLWFGGPASQPGGPGARMAAIFYQQQSASMAPEVVCDTYDKFLDYTTDVYAEPIAARFDAGVELIGWRALRGPYPSNGEFDDARRVLLARSADGTPIIAVARFVSDELDLGSSGPDVKVHDFEVAGVRITEFSPFPGAVLDDVLYLEPR
ncbi:MAG: hypothetical protein AAGI30_13565 [Planctomycetota bacterium]